MEPIATEYFCGEMKKAGCGIDYKIERAADLRAAWRRQFDEAPASVPRREIMRRAVESPARRFWVSECEALRVVKLMLMRGGEYKHVDSRRELYTEIYRRTATILAERGGEPADVIVEVLHQSAPKFYLTPASAHEILSGRR